MALDLTFWLYYRGPPTKLLNLAEIWSHFPQLERIILVIPTRCMQLGQSPIPEELASLNFEQMDTDFGIGTFHMEGRAKAVNTFREWAFADFKRTSTLYPEWKVSKLEFKMMLRGGSTIREIDEYLDTE